MSFTSHFKEQQDTIWYLMGVLMAFRYVGFAFRGLTDDL